MIRVGCAWLNKPGSLDSGGWASVCGDEAFSFTDLSYLQGRADLWLVQSSKKEFLSDSGRRFKWMRHGDFLTTPLKSIAEELGVGDSIQRAAAATSEVVTRAVSLACDAAPALASIILDTENADKSLPEMLQHVVAPAGRRLDLPEDLMKAMPSLYKGYPVKEGSGYLDLLVRVPAARIDLYEHAMAQEVPGDIWKEIPPLSIPNPLTWAMKGGFNIIANVSVVSRSDKSDRGGKGDQKKSGDLTIFRDFPKGTRRWMALPEIAAMSKIFDLKAEQTFICEDSAPMTSMFKVAPPVFSPVAKASISAGLLAEAFLHAGASPSIVQSATDEGGIEVSPYSIRSVWMSSIARAQMLLAGLELAQSGIAVAGAGMSHVFAATKKDKLRFLRLAIIKNLGLTYPTGLRATEEKYKPVNKTVVSYEMGQDDDGSGDDS